MRTALQSRQAITEQIARIQRELASLADLVDQFDPQVPDDGVPAEWIRSMVRAKRRRDSIFPDEGFGDPGWDLLLALYSVELTNGEIATSELGNAASVAPSTALRWLGQLERSGLIERTRDKTDKRRLFVKLAPRGLALMREYFGHSDRG